MNRIYKLKFLSSLLLMIMALSACEKVLDVKNFSAVDQDAIWGNQNAMQLLVNNIYASAEPDNFGRDFANAPHPFRYLQGIITDEARPATTFVGRTNAINNGVSFTAASAPFQRWSYPTIRLCNDFLEGIEKFYQVPAGSAQESNRNNLIGQVKFFRAFTYWRMVQIYGGVPIIDKVLNTESPELYGERNTMEESFQFIINDLKSAASLLPLTAGSGNRGRITKGAALGLLSRVLLYRASPMYSPTSNAQYWQEASDAAKAVLDMPQYSIDGVAFGQWYFDKDNTETIWQVEFEKGRAKREHGYDAGNMSFVPLAREDVGGHCPSQELVDAFPMINGKPITDGTSGYNPNDPYVNRDPRFKATILTNGDKYGVDETGQPVELYSFVSEGDEVPGNNKFNPNGYTKLHSSSTGYWLRKAMDERLVSNAALREYGYGYGSYSNWVEMRLGEIMLNYAEAENELGRPAAGYEMIGKLRARAGISSAGNYGLPGGASVDVMRSIIQNERFIELAFENKRYWDLKRWRLAEVVLNRPTHSVVITKKDNTPKTSNGTDYTYKYIVNMHDAAFPPVFQEKFYFLPIPQSQILLNPNLEQNPLWK